MAEKTAAQKRAQKAYMEKFAVARVRMKHEQYEQVQIHAASRGESVNSFINRAIAETMERDGAGGPQEAAGATVGAGGTLSPDALESAQAAAEATGEALAVFIARAIETQAKRDKSSIVLGINPATGDKLKGEA